MFDGLIEALKGTTLAQLRGRQLLGVAPCPGLYPLPSPLLWIEVGKGVDLITYNRTIEVRIRVAVCPLGGCPWGYGQL